MTGQAESLQKDNQYRETFNATIGETLSQAVRIIAGEPALVIPGTVILHHQRKAAAVRKQHEMRRTPRPSGHDREHHLALQPRVCRLLHARAG